MNTPRNKKNWDDLKRVVHERDQYRCTNCLRSGEQVILDVDHAVPRSAGGSDRLSNLAVECRRCHDAKHGKGIAPAVQLESTGRMTQDEFNWFEQFVKSMLPAMALKFDVRLIPKFGLDDNKAWYLPLGDIRRLDRQLTRDDVEYVSTRLEDYM